MLAESYKQAHKKHQPGIDGVGDEHGQAQQRLQRSIQVAGVALIHEACTQMRDVHTINTWAFGCMLRIQWIEIEYSDIAFHVSFSAFRVQTISYGQPREYRYQFTAMTRMNEPFLGQQPKGWNVRLWSKRSFHPGVKSEYVEHRTFATVQSAKFG